MGRHSLLLTVLLPAVLAACTAGSPPPAPTATPAPPATASTTAPPAPPASDLPALPVPSPAADCPTGSPLTVDAYLAADPSCFGSADVTVAGWTDGAVKGWFGSSQIEPAWLGDEANEYSVLRSTLPGQPCTNGHENEGTDGPAACPGALVLHIPPVSAYSVEGTGRWLEVTGHRQDPASSTCRFAARDDEPGQATPAPGQVVEACASRFVLVQAHESTPPPEAVTALQCPEGDVLEMRDYVAAIPACFGGRTVRVRAWMDAPGTTGWEGPYTEPSWLDIPDGSRFFWSADPVDPDRCAAEACPGIFVHQDPASPVRLGKAGRWVEITGHREDPAAETCRYEPPGGPDDPVESALVARRLCRSAFVIESIRAAEAP